MPHYSVVLTVPRLYASEERRHDTVTAAAQGTCCVRTAAQQTCLLDEGLGETLCSFMHDCLLRIFGANTGERPLACCEEERPVQAAYLPITRPGIPRQRKAPETSAAADENMPCLNLCSDRLRIPRKFDGRATAEGAVFTRARARTPPLRGRHISGSSPHGF